MTDGEKDNAGVMTPPQLIYGAGLLPGWGSISCGRFPCCRTVASIWWASS